MSDEHLDMADQLLDDLEYHNDRGVEVEFLAGLLIHLGVSRGQLKQAADLAARDLET